MKFESINGVQHIILDKNDKICLTTSEELGKRKVTINGTEGGLDISGDSSIVSSIRGDGMLDKIYIPPVLSSDDIAEKCDKWLDMFRKVHDTFKDLVLTREYNHEEISMSLSFPIGVSFNGKKGRYIKLDLVKYGDSIKDGVSIYVDDECEDIYAYLVANVIDYYLQKNYEGFKVDLYDPSFSNCLYSDFSSEIYRVKPMVASIGLLLDDSYYYKVVSALINTHAVDVPSKQFIENLRGKITCHMYNERFEEYLNYSTRQYEDIVSNLVLDKGPVLSKTNA